MIILKRFFVENNHNSELPSNPVSSSEKALRYEYLITSLEIFNKHKEYFTVKKYEKHLILESDHLVGMKAQYALNLDQAA